MTDEALARTVEQVLAPLDRWAHRCAEASGAVVNSHVVDVSRVARGSCRGVADQPSWVVDSEDCYVPLATIVDPTLWSYARRLNGVWIGSYSDGLHRPFGGGSIWDWGRPDKAKGKVIHLTPRKPFSQWAEDFLRLLG